MDRITENTISSIGKIYKKNWIISAKLIKCLNIVKFVL